MSRTVKPKNSPADFRFTIKELQGIELLDWPDEAVKLNTDWNTSVNMFNKLIPYLNKVVFYSPYPLSAISIGAAIRRETFFIVRLFLFPLFNPKYQNQTVGQIIVKFEFNGKPGDVELSLDFMKIDELSSQNILEIEKAIFNVEMQKLFDKYPGKIQFAKDEKGIDRINFYGASTMNEEVFNNYDTKMLVFIKEELLKGKEISIQPASKTSLLVLSAINLLKK